MKHCATCKHWQEAKLTPADIWPWPTPRIEVDWPRKYNLTANARVGFCKAPHSKAHQLFRIVPESGKDAFMLTTEAFGCLIHEPTESK